MALQVANLRNLAATPANRSKTTTRAAETSTVDVALDPLRRVVGWLVALVEVIKTILRVALLSLPLTGPLGILAWNMDLRPKSGGAKFDISAYTGFWSNTLAHIGDVGTVLKVAVGLGRNAGGDMPGQKPEDGMAGQFSLPPNLQGLRGSADSSDAAGVDEEDLLKSLAASTKPKPAKKAPNAASEAPEAQEVVRALDAAAADHRLFDDAEAAVKTFAGRYPKSKRRPPLQQRLMELAALRNRALAERSSIVATSHLTTLAIGARDARRLQACLGSQKRVRAVAVVQKQVEVQPGIPAYFVIADVERPTAPAGAAAQEGDSGDRLAMARAVSGCFPAMARAGTLVVTFWADPAMRALAPALAATKDALVYARQ